MAIAKQHVSPASRSQRANESTAPATDQVDASVVVRRATPELFILNADLQIVSASRGAAWLLETADPAQAQQLATVVRHALAEPPIDIGLEGENETAGSVAISDLFGETILLRVLPLQGGHAGHLAVLSERLQLRDPITRAAARFNLSPRERDVLREVMLGHGTSGIAQTLGIAETTVADHVKRIAMKTDSHRRSEIIAKVLGTR